MALTFTQTAFAAPADIIFLLDGSSSVGYDNFLNIQAFLIRLVGTFDIDSGNTRVGLVVYSDGVESWKDIYLRQYNSYPGALRSLQRAIADVSYGSGGSTDTHKALAYVRNWMLTERLGDRSNVTNVIVVLTNGWSTNPEYTKVSITIR